MSESVVSLEGGVGGGQKRSTGGLDIGSFEKVPFGGRYGGGLWLLVNSGIDGSFLSF